MKIALSRKNLWERSPRIIRSGAGPLLGLLPPATALGKGFRHATAFIRDSQWWDHEQIREYQTASLRSVCVSALQSPFWRDVFQNSGVDPRGISLDHLRRLPLLDRDTVRDHLLDMCTRPPIAHDVDYVSTSGSTGSPVAFYIGADRSSIEYAYTVAGWERAGYRLGAPLAVFKGRPVRRGHRGSYHEYDALLRYHAYSVYHMADSHMSRYLAHIASLGPCYLLGYPSAIYALGRHLGRTGTPPPANVKGIVTESETLYPDQRAFLEKVFRCRCFSLYGQTEKVVAAAECERTSDYHVWPTYGICELLDAAGRPVTQPGERGEIVGTSFLNSVVPFIRYRTGDYATLLGNECTACGRKHLLLGALRGHRSQEVLVAVDGALIPWTALNMHDDTFAHVVRFQFDQDTPGFAVLYVVPDVVFSALDRHRIAARLRQKLDDRLTVTVECVDALPMVPNGKAVYVNQRVPSIDRWIAELDDGLSAYGQPQSLAR